MSTIDLTPAQLDLTRRKLDLLALHLRRAFIPAERLYDLVQSAMGAEMSEIGTQPRTFAGLNVIARSNDESLERRRTAAVILHQLFNATTIEQQTEIIQTAHSMNNTPALRDAARQILGQAYKPCY